MSQEKVLCSSWARTVNLSPAGTAGFYEGILLLQWPLPWPRDVSEVFALQELVHLAAKLQIRVQLITENSLPIDEDKKKQDLKVACYHGAISKKYFPADTQEELFSAEIGDLSESSLPGKNFYSGLGVIEGRVPSQYLPDVALQILYFIERLTINPGSTYSPRFTGQEVFFSEQDLLFLEKESKKLLCSLDRLSFIPETAGDVFDISKLTEAAFSLDTGKIRDILICTHGRRDRCCGSLGMSLYDEICNMDFFAKGAINYYRTSHTGGHRFAPTAIVLPQGSLWAFLDQEVVGKIVTQDQDCKSLKAHYRGSIGMEKSEFQVVEAELFASWNDFYPSESGWDFLNSTRQAYIDGDKVTFFSLSNDRQIRQFTAFLKEKRSVSAPECGALISSEPEATGTGKSVYVEYEVTDLYTENDLVVGR